MTPISPGAPSAVPLRQDARTIALIGLAHGSSHFFHMLLPPLFPWLIGEFGYSYSELGLLVSVFFVVSGVGQALSGFLVDRVGARPVLFFALASFATAGLVAGTAQGYTGLLLAAALAGLATQFAWGFMELLAFSAFYRADPTAFPMSFEQTVSYIWLQQAFLALFMTGNRVGNQQQD